MYVKIDSFDTSDYDLEVIQFSEFADAAEFDELENFDKFNSRKRTVSFLFRNDFGFREIKRMLYNDMKRSKIIFGNDEDVHFFGKTTSVSFEQLTLDLYKVVVEFLIEPFAYLPEKSETLTASGTITNSGDVYSEPEITIFGNGETRVTIGDFILDLNIDTKLVIECQKKQANVYDKNGKLANSRMKGDFPVLRVGVNGVVLGAGVSSIVFKKRERVY